MIADDIARAIAAARECPIEGARLVVYHGASAAHALATIEGRRIDAFDGVPLRQSDAGAGVWAGWEA